MAECFDCCCDKFFWVSTMAQKARCSVLSFSQLSYDFSQFICLRFFEAKVWMKISGNFFVDNDQGIFFTEVSPMFNVVRIVRSLSVGAFVCDELKLKKGFLRAVII